MFNKPVLLNVGTKYGNNRWLVKSEKINRTVYLFSDLEYEHWLTIEFDPNITFFCEQPLVIEFLSEDKKVQKSIPDMYLRYKDGTEVIREIKYSIDLEDERVINQIDIQKKWCSKNNFVHQIKTEKDLKNNPVLSSNLKTILNYRAGSKNLDLSCAKEILELINHNPLTIIQIANHLHLPIDMITGVVFKLILLGKIEANLSEKYLGTYLEVWTNE